MVKDESDMQTQALCAKEKEGEPPDPSDFDCHWWLVRIEVGVAGTQVLYVSSPPIIHDARLITTWWTLISFL